MTELDVCAVKQEIIACVSCWNVLRDAQLLMTLVQ